MGGQEHKQDIIQADRAQGRSVRPAMVLVVDETGKELAPEHPDDEWWGKWKPRGSESRHANSVSIHGFESMQLHATCRPLAL